MLQSKLISHSWALNLMLNHPWRSAPHAVLNHSLRQKKKKKSLQGRANSFIWWVLNLVNLRKSGKACYYYVFLAFHDDLFYSSIMHLSRFNNYYFCFVLSVFCTIAAIAFIKPWVIQNAKDKKGFVGATRNLLLLRMKLVD